MERKYDATILFSPELSEEEITKDIDSLTKITGESTEKTDLQRINLAYPINGKQNAFMVVLLFTADSKVIKEFEKQIKENNKIIRHLLVKKEERKIKEKRRRKKMDSEPVKRKSETRPGKKEKADLDSIEEKIDTILDK